MKHEETGAVAMPLVCTPAIPRLTDSCCRSCRSGQGGYRAEEEVGASPVVFHSRVLGPRRRRSPDSSILAVNRAAPGTEIAGEGGGLGRRPRRFGQGGWGVAHGALGRDLVRASAVAAACGGAEHRRATAARGRKDWGGWLARVHRHP